MEIYQKRFNYTVDDVIYDSGHFGSKCNWQKKFWIQKEGHLVQSIWVLYHSRKDVAAFIILSTRNLLFRHTHKTSQTIQLKKKNLSIKHFFNYSPVIYHCNTKIYKLKMELICIALFKNQIVIIILDHVFKTYSVILDIS